jgi:hypothetical protein
MAIRKFRCAKCNTEFKNGAGLSAHQRGKNCHPKYEVPYYVNEELSGIAKPPSLFQLFQVAWKAKVEERNIACQKLQVIDAQLESFKKEMMDFLDMHQEKILTTAETGRMTSGPFTNY